MEYRTSLYRRETIRRLLLHFQHLLESLAGHPDTPLGELPLFADGEREEIEARMGGAARCDGNQSGCSGRNSMTRSTPTCSRGGDVCSGTPAAWLCAGGARCAAAPAAARIPGQLYLAAPGDDPPQATPFLGRNAEGGGVESWGRASDIVRMQGFRFNVRAVELALRAQPEVRPMPSPVSGATAWSRRSCSSRARRRPATICALRSRTG